MEQYKQFVDQHRDYFETKQDEASWSTDFVIRGFSVFSAKDAFDKLLVDDELYYFALCLYLIQLGVGVAQDKTFSQSAFRSFLSDATQWTKMPVLSYFYAYGENRYGDLILSENILDRLAQAEFMPAMMTRGDLAWMNGDPKLARKWYDAAAIRGHVLARTRRAALFYSMPKRFIYRCAIIPKIVFSSLFGQQKGPKHIYLNIYGFKRYP